MARYEHRYSPLAIGSWTDAHRARIADVVWLVRRTRVERNRTIFEERLGFRPGRRHAFLAGLAEAGGGLLLALGLLIPLGAAAAISVMVVAVFSVHIQKGFFVN